MKAKKSISFYSVTLHLKKGIIKLLLVSFIAIFVSGCLSSARINKWVSTYYEGVSIAGKEKKESSIIITSNFKTLDTNLSVTRKKSMFFLPLFFYYKYDYKNRCVLNPKIGIDHFADMFFCCAREHGFEKKLNGRRIELIIEQMPNFFEVSDNGHLIWAVYTFGWNRITIQPDKKDLVVAYKIFDGADQVKNGMINVQENSTRSDMLQFQAPRKKVWMYLCKYETDISEMSQKVMDKLIAEL